MRNGLQTIVLSQIGVAISASPLAYPANDAAPTFDWGSFWTALSAVSTALAVLVGLAAAVAAVRQLTVSAEASKLGAVLETNQHWQRTRDAQRQVTLREATLRHISSFYAAAGVCSVLPEPPPQEVSALAPKILGVLGPRVPMTAPRANDAPTYERVALARALLVGSLMNSLRDAALTNAEIRDDLIQLTEAVTGWVNQLNELAELYGEKIIDRRLLIGKVHVDLSRAVWYAEPYILWRNTTHPGRWGLRLLAFGEEARQYHWTSPLQNSPVMEDADIDDLAPTHTYPGFCVSQGWMYGPGRSDIGKLKRSERAIRSMLGSGFTLEARRRQLEIIEKLPCSALLLSEDRVSAGTWEALRANQDRYLDAFCVLGLQKGS